MELNIIFDPAHRIARKGAELGLRLNPGDHPVDRLKVLRNRRPRSSAAAIAVQDKKMPRLITRQQSRNRHRLFNGSTSLIRQRCRHDSNSRPTKFLPFMVGNAHATEEISMPTVDTKIDPATLNAKFLNKDGPTLFETKFTEHDLE